MQCKNCQKYIEEWCDRKQDSPDPDLERDCDQFVDRFADIIDFLGDDYDIDRLRELVEKVWRGEWMFPIFADQQDANDPRCQCSECGNIETPLARHRFCPSCGAPMTDEAVEMVMERLEAMRRD